MLMRAFVMQVKARSGRKRGRSTGWEPGLLMPHATMFKNRTLRSLRILNVNLVFRLLFRHNCQCRHLEHILLYRFLVSFRTFKYIDIRHVSPHLVILPWDFANVSSRPDQNPQTVWEVFIHSKATYWHCGNWEMSEGAPSWHNDAHTVLGWENLGHDLQCSESLP